MILLYAEIEPDNQLILATSPKQEFDEQALSDWLSDEDRVETNFTFDKPIDAKSVDSAGMDIDAMLEMGGEDGMVSTLTPDQKRQYLTKYQRLRRTWHPEIQVKRA